VSTTETPRCVARTTKGTRCTRKATANLERNNRLVHLCSQHGDADRVEVGFWIAGTGERRAPYVHEGGEPARPVVSNAAIDLPTQQALREACPECGKPAGVPCQELSETRFLGVLRCARPAPRGEPVTLAVLAASPVTVTETSPGVRMIDAPTLGEALAESRRGLGTQPACTCTTCVRCREPIAWPVPHDRLCERCAGTRCPGGTACLDAGEACPCHAETLAAEPVGPCDGTGRNDEGDLAGHGGPCSWCQGTGRRSAKILTRSPGDPVDTGPNRCRTCKTSLAADEKARGTCDGCAGEGTPDVVPVAPGIAVYVPGWTCGTDERGRTTHGLATWGRS
jgi:hypothetical protein